MTLSTGDKAPDFNLPTDGGGMLALKDLKGKAVSAEKLESPHPEVGGGGAGGDGADE